MPSVSDCPICQPCSPFADSKPWRTWQHRTLAEIFTRAGRARWRERRAEVELIHELAREIEESYVRVRGGS